MQHFFICFIIIKWNDGNTIVYLESKTVDTVVNDYYVFEISVTEYSQVFDVIAFGGKIAMLSVKPMFNILVIWINIVQNSISIYLMARCKHDNLEVFVRFLKTFHNIRTYIDASINRFLIRKVDLKYHIWILSFNIVNAVDQCFIHVEYDQLLLALLAWRWEINDQVLHLFLFDDADVVLDKL